MTELLLLEAIGLAKSYGGHSALAGMSLRVGRGEVVGLIGENGAGKSTLLNILSGTATADHGEMIVRGKVYKPTSYRDAVRRGVYRVFQELAMVSTMPVYENMFLAHEDQFPGFGPKRISGMRQRAKELLTKYDHGHVSVESRVSDLDFPTRQILEVIKCVGLAELYGIDHPVILLDEPTTALSLEETEFFTAFIKRLKEDAGIVFVSHRLEELTNLSDRLMIMKDGALVAQTPDFEPVPEQIHSLMVGRERDEAFYCEDRQLPVVEGEIALSCRDLTDAGGEFRSVSFDLRCGEILGIGGVIGSGKSTLGATIYGLLGQLESGEVRVKGKLLSRLSVRRSMRNGFGYVPPERGEIGILGDHSIAWNISLPRQGPGDVDRTPLRRTSETRSATTMIEQFRIKTTGPHQAARDLSGGNQQKVMLARWVARPTEILILDNPTRGVDAGAKGEIYERLRELASEGMAVLLVTDDLLELIGLSDRILVMKDGAVVHECTAAPQAKPDETELVARMI